VAPYYICKFGLNRLRIDGDIRQKAAITAILENVVIAIYRLRPIQKHFADVFQMFYFTCNHGLRRGFAWRFLWSSAPLAMCLNLLISSV